MIIKAKRIKFASEEDTKECVHNVISLWLRELDLETDETVKRVIKQKVTELQQVTSGSGKTHIHFHDGNHKYDKVIFVDE